MLTSISRPPYLNEAARKADEHRQRERSQRNVLGLPASDDVAVTVRAMKKLHEAAVSALPDCKSATSRALVSRPP